MSNSNISGSQMTPKLEAHLSPIDLLKATPGNS